MDIKCYLFEKGNTISVNNKKDAEIRVIHFEPQFESLTYDQFIIRLKSTFDSIDYDDTLTTYWQSGNDLVKFSSTYELDNALKLILNCKRGRRTPAPLFLNVFIEAT